MKTSKSKSVTRRSIFGCMKGTLSIPKGVDLTEPVWPDWETYIDDKFGPDSELGVLFAAAVKKYNAGEPN
ncbi:MAG: hypothetical protein BroJett030_26310 [Alphaproteobacteria bacterium]|nr:MAG: hypothetical protein BroJett030_26310 [Alphaproteobacteria bacterium]